MTKRPDTQFGDEYNVVVARNIAEIEAIRPIWEQMQCNEQYPVPNADIDRYLSVAKASGDDVRPYVMLIKSDGRPVAMTIGRIEKHRLDFKLGYKRLFSTKLQCLAVVYGGIIGKASSDIYRVLIGELMDALRRREADVLYFNRLKIDAPIYKLFKTASSFWRRNHSMLTESHWQTNIPNTVEEFYSKIPSSRKRRWRRNIRQLEKISSSEIKIVCYRQISDVDQLMDMAYRIRERTYKHSLAVGFTNSALNRALLEQAARDGWLMAYILYVGDEPCAFQFDIQYRGKQFTEYGSFDPKWSRGSPGTVLLLKVLEQLCEDPGISVMDYGFGDALYKGKFGSDHWLEKSVYIFAPRLRPILINMALSTYQALYLLLSRATICLNLDSWVKRNWRKMVCKHEQKDSAQERGNE